MRLVFTKTKVLNSTFKVVIIDINCTFFIHPMNYNLSTIGDQCQVIGAVNGEEAG